MVSNCGALIGLMAGVLARAELEITNPRGYDIEDTEYCMVDAGSKGKAVFELLEVAEPIWEGRVALGEIPSPRVKKPASFDITVEAVIETRQAADGHVEAAARPEAVDIASTTVEPPSGAGDIGSGLGTEPERKSVNGQEAAVRLVQLKCGKKFKLGGPLAEDVDDDDAICEDLTQRALAMGRFNRVLGEWIPSVEEMLRQGRGESMFHLCSRAVRAFAAHLTRSSFGEESEKNSALVRRLCGTRLKKKLARLDARSSSTGNSTCCSAMLCLKAGEFCPKSCCGVTCPAKSGVGWWVLK